MKNEATREAHRTPFFGRDLGMSEAAKEAAKFVVAPSREATGNVLQF